ncbi:MAG: tetratricopeptide repeat protein [Promethearchaeota archaeon]
MSYSESKELAQARKFIDKCKFDEAEHLIKNFEEKGGQILHDTVLCQYLKCELLFWRGLHKDVIKLAEQAYKESLGLEKNFLSVNILLIMAYSLLMLNKSEESYEIVKQGEKLLKALTQELPIEYKQREAYIAFLKGWYYTLKNEEERAIKQFELSISLREEISADLEIIHSLIGIAYLFTFLKGDYKRALKYLERGIIIAEESGNRWCIGYLTMRIARIHMLKGELDQSIILYDRSLTIFNDLDNKFMVAWILSLLGDVNRQKGELNRALENIEQGLALDRQLGLLQTLAIDHYNFIQVLVDIGDIKRAQQALHDLEQLNNQSKDKIVNFLYLLDKAIVLKTSPRARNRVEAEEIFKQVLEDEDSNFLIKLRALTNLCELLLTELRVTNDLEVFDELTQCITRLLAIAKKSHSYSILCETYLFQAKLALISLNLKEARRLLTQGQKITEKYGLILLSRKISHEHDELLKQLEIWEKLKESKAPLAERMDLSRLNEQMEQMIRKRAINIPELSDEKPVLLFIISEGGIPFFSQKFIKDQTFEDYLFGGFFTAVNTFIREQFSEGLDRAIFGEHTLLMNSVSPFLICYVYKGQSYSAQQRIRTFIDKIQNDELVWQTFKKFYQLNQEIQLKDIPSLESLIKEIFIDKNIQLIS